MSCSRIATGAKEPIEFIALSRIGRPLTGVSDLFVRIRRVSDDFFFDWDDNWFKSSPTQQTVVLSEIDSVDAPGEYHLNTVTHVRGFDTSEIQNPILDDTYEVTIDQASPGTVSSVPVIGEIKVGQYVDDIPDFTELERMEIKSVLGITGTGTPNDSPQSGVLSIILGLVQQNFFLDSTVYNSSGMLTAARIRIFPTKTDADGATDGGTGEGELAMFNVSAEAEVSPLDCVPKTYKVTRE